MTPTTYNGWHNYETWVTALWLNNDASSYGFWREQARDCWQEAPQSRRMTEWNLSRVDAATLELAERLKDAIEEANPAQNASLFADLMSSAIQKIDFREIADHYVDEVADEAAEELRGEGKPS